MTDTVADKAAGRSGVLALAEALCMAGTMTTAMSHARAGANMAAAGVGWTAIAAVA